MIPIADMRTGYGEKFGVPRQPGLAPSAKGVVVFREKFRSAEAVRGLEAFSHVWIIFGFHLSEGWSPTVRPPRLGGNARVGVFASRSPFRPNPIGLSAVKLDAVDVASPDGPLLRVSGVDLVDGSPIYDIKPYVPYADAIPGANGGFAKEAPGGLKGVVFAPGVEETLAACEATLPAFVRETLASDPRPSFHDEPERVYGVLLGPFNIHFRIVAGIAEALSAEPVR